MAGTFDPYHKWLGIPREEQPAHYYRLLGIPLFEDDLQVIEGAADRQMTYLRRFQSSEHAEAARTVLNEVSRARLCLLKPNTKSKYDAELKALLDEAGTSEDIDSDEVQFDQVVDVPEMDFDTPKRSRRPVWQQPPVLAGAVVAVVALIGLFVFLNSGPANPPAKAVAKKNSQAEPEPAEGSPSNGSPETNGTQSAPKTNQNQPRPQATGNKAPWPTLLDDDEPTGNKSNPSNNGPKSPANDFKIPAIPKNENLISQIELLRDTVQGTWEIKDGVLVSRAGYRDRILLPAKVPSSYTLTVIAERPAAKGFGLLTYLPVGKNQVLATLDGWNGETSGLELIDNKEGDINESMSIGKFTQPGLNKFVYRVQPNQIIIEANDQRVLEWTGDSQAFSLHPQYTVPHADRVGFAVFGVEWRIHAVTLTPKPQTVVKVEPATDKPAMVPAGFKVPSISKSENLITKIDPARDSVQGTWKIEAGVLIAPAVQRDRIRIPVKVPANYTVTMLAERPLPGGDGLLMILPVGQGQTLACIDCWNGRVCGMELVNGAQGNANETTTYARLLKPGVNTFIYRVTPNSVHVEVNGRRAIDWEGDSKTLALHEFYAMPKVNELGIAGGRVEWRILGIKLKTGDSESSPNGTPSTVMEDAPEGSLVVEKKPIPDAATQETAKKTLRELFKIDYAQAKKQDGKIALARTLFSRGQEVDNDPPACYVMLHEAAELAAEAGQLGLAWDAIVALTDRFEGNRLPLMERAAKTAGPFAKTFDEVRELTLMYTNLTNEAIRVNDFETAYRLMQAATQAVRKPLFANLKDQVASANKRVLALREAFDSVKSARETLQKNPTDPTACLAWGRFLCFHKNNWTEGLRLLALATNPVLSPLAQRELGLNEQTPPPESKEIAKLGDDWWELAEKEKEPLRSIIREHAAESYLLAQGGVQGLEKTALQQKADRIFGTTKFAESTGNQAGVIVAPADFNPGNFFTIECWISTRGLTGPLLSKRHMEVGETSLLLHLNEGIPQIMSNGDGHWEQATGKTTINDGLWHHLAAVKLGNQLLLFVDGKKEGQLDGLDVYVSKTSPWKAGTSLGLDPIAVRVCRVRLSSTPRYLLPFTPEKQYAKDSATLFPK